MKLKSILVARVLTVMIGATGCAASMRDAASNYAGNAYTDQGWNNSGWNNAADGNGAAGGRTRSVRTNRAGGGTASGKPAGTPSGGTAEAGRTGDDNRRAKYNRTANAGNTGRAANSGGAASARRARSTRANKNTPSRSASDRNMANMSVSGRSTAANSRSGTAASNKIARKTTAGAKTDGSYGYRANGVYGTRNYSATGTAGGKTSFGYNVVNTPVKTRSYRAEASDAGANSGAKVTPANRDGGMSRRARANLNAASANTAGTASAKRASVAAGMSGKAQTALAAGSLGNGNTVMKRASANNAARQAQAASAKPAAGGAAKRSAATQKPQPIVQSAKAIEQLKNGTYPHDRMADGTRVVKTRRAARPNSGTGTSSATRMHSGVNTNNRTSSRSSAAEQLKNGTYPRSQMADGTRVTDYNRSSRPSDGTGANTGAQMHSGVNTNNWINSRNGATTRSASYTDGAGASYNNSRTARSLRPYRYGSSSYPYGYASAPNRYNGGMTRSYRYNSPARDTGYGDYGSGYAGGGYYKQYPYGYNGGTLGGMNGGSYPAARNSTAAYGGGTFYPSSVNTQELLDISQTGGLYNYRNRGYFKGTSRTSRTRSSRAGAPARGVTNGSVDTRPAAANSNINSTGNMNTAPPYSGADKNSLAG